MLSIGIDIASVARFVTLRNPRRVASFYLCADEIAEAERAPNFAIHLASRFSAKEAVIKATPITLSPLDFEIRKQGVRPIVVPRRTLPYRYELSLSHEREFTIATALCQPA